MSLTEDYPVTGEERLLGEALVREFESRKDGLVAHETPRQLFKVKTEVVGNGVEMVQLRGQVAEFSTFHRQCEESLLSLVGEEARSIAEDLAGKYFESLIALYSAAGIKVYRAKTAKGYWTLKLASGRKKGTPPPALPLWRTVAEFNAIVRRTAQAIQETARGSATILPSVITPSTVITARTSELPRATTSASPTAACPWLSHAEDIKKLQTSGATERDHEGAVKEFLILLGHSPEHVRFQRGRIDVLVTDGEGDPCAVYEVKRSLRRMADRDDALRKGHDYARKVGAPLVVITDADRYEAYDLRCGLRYEEQLRGSFQITAWREEYAAIVDLLRPKNP